MLGNLVRASDPRPRFVRHQPQSRSSPPVLGKTSMVDTKCAVSGRSSLCTMNHKGSVRLGANPLMLYKTLSAAVYGIDASIIEVEVDVAGIKTKDDYFHTVGLPGAAVRESRDRVRAALKNWGYDIPPTHITINLALADIRKEGSGFDLPMALGILGAYGGLNKKEVPDWLFVGARSLHGGIRGIRGTLPIAIEARGKKIRRMVVPT